MGRKDVSSARIPLDQYRKQIALLEYIISLHPRTIAPVINMYSLYSLVQTRWSEIERLQCYASLLGSQSLLNLVKFIYELTGMEEVSLVLAAILVFLLACYAFFYLKLSEEVDLDLDQDEN